MSTQQAGGAAEREVAPEGKGADGPEKPSVAAPQEKAAAVAPAAGDQDGGSGTQGGALPRKTLPKTIVVPRVFAQKLDIGHFSTHGNSLGVALLADEGQSGGTADRDQVMSLVQQLDGAPGASFRSFPGAEILDAATRGLLMRHLDGLSETGSANRSGGSDFKVFFSLEELTRFIGGEAMERLEAAYARGQEGAANGAPRLVCNKVALRRAGVVGAAKSQQAQQTQQETPHCINFHCDVQSTRTLQVPLNGDDEYEGGRLVFATDDGRLQYPKRPAGSVTVHGGGVVHGVTALRRGVRYSLFLLHETKND